MVKQSNVKIAHRKYIDREEKIMAEWVERKSLDIKSLSGATPSTKSRKTMRVGKLLDYAKGFIHILRRYIERGERNITEIGLKTALLNLATEHRIVFIKSDRYVAITANEVLPIRALRVLFPMKIQTLFLFYLLKYNKG